MAKATRPQIGLDTVLAGDIGGTNARFRLAPASRPAEPIVDRVLPVAGHATFEDALATFLAGAGVGAPRHAAFAVAGPVQGPTAKLTNAAWTIDAGAVARRFRIARVRLANDFEAAAAGIAHLPPESFESLQRGARQAEAPRLVIGAGTGLGVAFTVPTPEGGTRILGGEGGHVPFAPQDEEQRALHAFVAVEVGRVTAEHVLSGAGLVRLHAFARSRAGTPPPTHKDLPRGAASVTELAQRDDPAARRAVALFCTILGAVAGDHALTLMTRGGVFVAGGIAPRLAPALADGRFVAAFRAKGVHAALMEAIPVDLVRDDRLGLTGAAALAAAQQG
jgi:glucokinase